MIFNPVFQRELRSAVRSGRIFLLASVYALALGGLAIQAWPDPAQALFGSRLGEQIFAQFRWLQLGLALGLAPALTWSAISAEREQRTWSTLRATPLRPQQIVLGKLACALMLLVLLIGASLPVTCYCFFLGGVSPREVRAAYTSALLAGAAATCIGLACSALMRKTYLAIALAYVLIGTMAGLLWPLQSYGRTAAVALGFFVIAVLRARAISESDIASKLGVGLRPEAAAPATDDFAHLIDGTGNLVAARELTTARHTRRLLVAGVFVGSLILPVALLIALLDRGLPFVRSLFPGYAVAQLALVMVVASSLGGYLLAAEKERRTMQLLLSTPLSATSILQGKMRFALWHVALLGLMSAPVLTLAALVQVITFGELLILLAAQLAYGLAFAVIGSFFSLRTHRTNRALGLTLGFLLFISSLSLQVLPLSADLAATRGGQWLLATNPLQTVWEREQPPPWEAPPRRRPPPAGASPPSAPRWFTAHDDLPGVSVLGASLAMYLAGAGLLWRVMRAKFRAWALSSA